MFIVDLNQVMISNLMVQLGNHTNMKLEESMVRHMVLNSLRSYKSKYGNEFGEMIIAADNTNYWRRKFFPYYKASRKENQKKSDLDWNAIFETFNMIRQELKYYFSNLKELIVNLSKLEIKFISRKLNSKKN